ncbi:outer membrane beta-barrel protein [Halopseudomonas nanhaiensis]|uniref:OmpW family outer membrane protein n=1 Tax=Halopseudomonas nanhaiensis TaxID=2830842 RepID=UPI001CBF2086|nr:OmpW family outer membrane protein [Halopseudomonas nanhaiensis]UAW98113.1 outer membrane beta-barrel protein [Halopseudomonas nanhaiensis]
MSRVPQKLSAAILLAPALLAASVTAQAYETGDVILRAGAVAVDPQENSGKVKLDGTATDLEVGVDSNVQLGLTGTFMLSDKLGLGLLAATPFKHTINLNGVGELAEIKHLPPTLTLQYFPLGSGSALQPYVGAGLNYTTFFSEDFKSGPSAGGFNDLSLDDSWGLALEAGVDYMLTDNIVVNAAVWYADIDTEANFKVGDIPGKVSVDIDPYVYMVGLGYKF